MTSRGGPEKSSVKIHTDLVQQPEVNKKIHEMNFYQRLDDVERKQRSSQWKSKSPLRLKIATK